MQHPTLKWVLGMGAVAALAACSTDQTLDQGFDSHPLAAMEASVWVDDQGCKHWIIDDGIEGYLSPVLNRDGSPDCS
ncbi:MAG: hypothetical protein AAF415_03235 [Pseudomonadota bacterium]